MILVWVNRHCSEILIYSTVYANLNILILHCENTYRYYCFILMCFTLVLYTLRDCCFCQNTLIHSIKQWFFWYKSVENDCLKWQSDTFTWYGQRYVDVPVQLMVQPCAFKFVATFWGMPFALLTWWCSPCFPSLVWGNATGLHWAPTSTTSNTFSMN